MATPLASFNYLVNPTNPLEVQFQGDLSSNGETIDNWLWSFGDGDSNTIQSPLKVYSANGVYPVILQVGNIDGFNSVIQFVTLLTQNIPQLGLTIYQIVSKKIDAFYLTPDTVSILNFNIKKWQMYLQPQLPQPKVLDAELFNENAWPPLWNVLISELVMVDFLLDQLGKIAAGIKVTSETTTTNTGESTSGGNLKRVEMGPAIVEFYENKTLDPSATGKFAQFIYSDGGALDTYKKAVCSLALRIGAKIDYCDEIKLNRLFEVARKPQSRWPLL